MPLTAKDKTGNTVQIWINTGSTGSRVWLLLGEISKSALNIKDSMISTLSKGDLVESFAKGIGQVEIPITYEYNGDDDGWGVLQTMGDPLLSPDEVREVAILPVPIADIDDADPRTDGPVYAMRLFDYSTPNDANGAYQITGKFAPAKNNAYPFLFSTL